MHVLVVGPACSGFTYFSEGKVMGMKVTGLTTGKDNLVIPDDAGQHIANMVVVDSQDINAFVGAACRLHKADPVNGVLAGEELMVEHAAIVADVLGLPFISPTDVGGVRNKAEMRKRLLDAGVRVPRFATAHSAIDLEHAAKHVGFPAVIKPLKMAGSVGVARVNNMVELLAAYEDIVNDEGGWGVALGTEVLLEEFLVGTAYVVDGCVASSGEINVFEFCENSFGPQPHFQIVGYTAFRAEDVPDAEALTAYVTDVVRALNIPVGPFHAEVMRTKDGPVLIEIANRLPGSDIPQTAAGVTGVSLVHEALAAAVGLPRPAAKSPTTRAAGFCNVVAPGELLGKTYSRLEGWDEILRSPLVDSTTVEIKPGQLIPPHADERSWIAGVRFHAGSAAEATAFRRHVLEAVHVRA